MLNGVFEFFVVDAVSVNAPTGIVNVYEYTVPATVQSSAATFEKIAVLFEANPANVYPALIVAVIVTDFA